MQIAIDFDNTLTEDASLWRGFIEAAQKNGHRCFCVTARRDTSDNHEIIDKWMADNGIDIPIVCTSLRSKVQHVSKIGIKIDIWIDDDPKTLVNGH